MANGFLEMPDMELLAWAAVFSQQINENWSSYGLSEQQANTFVELTDTYRVAYDVNTSGHRSPITAATKRQARVALLADARWLVRIITAQKSVTDQQLINLGLPVRGSRLKAAAPDEAPTFGITNVAGGRVTMSVSRKPASAIGVTLFVHLGEDMPMASNGWQFVDNYSRSTFTAEFPLIPAGTKIWLCARWINTRLEAGPTCEPISTHLQNGQFRVGLALAA